MKISKNYLIFLENIKKLGFNKVYIFNDYDCNDHIWIEIKNPTSESILEYSKIYIEFLNKFKCDFEFLVFDDNEICESALSDEFVCFE